MNFRLPGPTPLPPQVAAALNKPMIDHRGPEFAAMQNRIVKGLKEILHTQQDLLLFTCSGTGALEAAVANTLSPGDPVLVLSAGLFGDRLSDLVHAFGAAQTKVDFEWGSAIDPDRVASELKAHPNVRAVLTVHNETSTGILHPLEQIAHAVRTHSDAVLVVDGVSSLGAVPVQMDAWGIDVLATASQKAWMCPPGLAMIGVSPRAWQAYESARSPHFYFDFAQAKKWVEKGQTPFTPAVATYFAMDAALALIQDEGIEVVYARHTRLARRTRELGRSLGLTPFGGDERFASPTVTALSLPDGIDGDRLRLVLRDEYNLIVGGGLGQLKGKVIRIGHLGYVHDEDIDAAMHAIGQAITQMRS